MSNTLLSCHVGFPNVSGLYKAVDIVIMTTESSKNRAITLSRMNFSGHVGQATISS